MKLSKTKFDKLSSIFIGFEHKRKTKLNLKNDFILGAAFNKSGLKCKNSLLYFLS